MVIKLLILTWELRYPQKRGFNKKRGGGEGGLEVVLHGGMSGGKWLILRKEGFAWVTRGLKD